MSYFRKPLTGLGAMFQPPIASPSSPAPLPPPGGGNVVYFDEGTSTSTSAQTNAGGASSIPAKWGSPAAGSAGGLNLKTIALLGAIGLGAYWLLGKK